MLSSCEQVRTLNPGGKPIVTLSSTPMVHRDGLAHGAPCKAGHYIAAWCDRESDEIRLPDDVTKKRLIALAYHELGHKIEIYFPAIWIILNSMATPDFPCGEDQP